MKLTTDESDRKDQRDRTQKLINKTEGLDTIQSTPPRILKGKARWSYIQLQPILAQTGFVKQADLQTVISLCMNIELLNTSYEDIQENGTVKPIYKTVVSPVNGEVLATDFTGYKRNPSTQILDSATAKIKSLSEELGLTPQARASLLSLAQDDKPQESLSEMLNKGSDF